MVEKVTNEIRKMIIKTAIDSHHHLFSINTEEVNFKRSARSVIKGFLQKLSMARFGEINLQTTHAKAHFKILDLGDISLEFDREIRHKDEILNLSRKYSISRFKFIICIDEFQNIVNDADHSFRKVMRSTAEKT